ncbi:MAG: YiiX/YebB-like N1pC/P60 family cysteine hydrolase [Prevotella sp.]|jgi:hypothetical protein
MKRTCFSLFLILVSVLALSAQDFAVDSLHSGDLLFVYSTEPNAITEVTEGWEGAAVDHVGIAVRDSGETGNLTVLEAVHKGVVFTPLDSFLLHNSHEGVPTVLVGRVTCSVDIPASIANAARQLGKPYDFYFMPDDKAFYCSELVQKSYVDVSGHRIFNPIPMSFHDRSGKIISYWKDYYSRAGLTVPEGADGSNPGDLSRNGKVKILGRLHR